MVAQRRLFWPYTCNAVSITDGSAPTQRRRNTLYLRSPERSRPMRAIRPAPIYGHPHRVSLARNSQSVGAAPTAANAFLQSSAEPHHRFLVVCTVHSIARTLPCGSAHDESQAATAEAPTQKPLTSP